MLLAETSYASSASGYVITGLLTILTMGYLADRAWQRREIKTQNDSLGLLQASQAVLLAALPITQQRLNELDTRTRTIETGYAVLSKEMERHENWHERQQNEKHS